MSDEMIGTVEQVEGNRVWYRLGASTKIVVVEYEGDEPTQHFPGERVLMTEQADGSYVFEPLVN